MKQLDVSSKKISSNNDCLLLEKHHRIHFDSHAWSLHAIAQMSEYMIQGLLYDECDVDTELTIDGNDDHYIVEEKPNTRLAFTPIPLSNINIQHDMIIQWVNAFRSDQALYRQTGATQSIGILTSELACRTIECIDFKTGAYKMLGALLKKYQSYAPVLFLSHRISADQVPLILKFQPQMVVCQSAISSTALHQFIQREITVFGFCRKNKFNRYSNFHI